MDWRAKVELFEQIKWECEFGIGIIVGATQALDRFRCDRELLRPVRLTAGGAAQATL